MGFWFLNWFHVRHDLINKGLVHVSKVLQQWVTYWRAPVHGVPSALDTTQTHANIVGEEPSKHPSVVAGNPQHQQIQPSPQWAHSGHGGATKDDQGIRLPVWYAQPKLDGDLVHIQYQQLKSHRTSIKINEIIVSCCNDIPNQEKKFWPNFPTSELIHNSTVQLILENMQARLIVPYYHFILIWKHINKDRHKKS